MPLIYFQQIFDDMTSKVGFNYTLFRGFSTRYEREEITSIGLCMTQILHMHENTNQVVPNF